jgi:probable addiction module antidote protein
MTPLKTVRWDVAEHLDSPESIADYLEAVFEIGDPQLIVAALGDVARARGMTLLASETGLSRESLYRSLAKEGNPEFGTVVKVLKALGLRMAATAEQKTGRKALDKPKPGRRAGKAAGQPRANAARAPSTRIG